MALTPKQDALLRHLLLEPTLARACAAAGCSERSGYTWLREPEFRAELLAARRQALDGAVGLLAQLAPAAVAALSRNLRCGNPATEVRAASAILDQCARALELLDLAARVEALEERVAVGHVGTNGRVRT